jgi:hypothetical protein
VSAPVTLRARHWARWRRRRARDAWRRGAHLDPWRDDARATWLCSWQRSGSTLLAEVLATAPRTRLVYEPANVPDGLVTGEAAAAVALPVAPGPALSSVERALQGRVRGPWVDQLAHGRYFSRRVVKDVRGVGLLPLVAARHPAAPIVLLVRHPLAVARSVVELGWTGDGEHDELLLAEATRWCVLHRDALRAPAARRAHAVAYEHLVTEPDDVLNGILAHLAAHHPTWQGLALDRTRLQRPSATSFRRTGAASPRDWVGSFDDVDDALVLAVAALLDDAGLGGLYGPGPTPLVGPHGVATALGTR